MSSGGGWVQATVCNKCGNLFHNPNLNLTTCNNCIATAKAAQARSYNQNQVCPSCLGRKAVHNTICTLCRRHNMTLCKHCQKWKKNHITMIDACADCVIKWQQDSDALKNIIVQNQPATSWATATSFVRGQYSNIWGKTSPSPINPLDSVYRPKENEVLLERVDVYQIFHQSAEEVLNYDWVIKAKDTLAPMIDMVTLAIINIVLERLGFETIDTKFFKEM